MQELELRASEVEVQGIQDVDEHAAGMGRGKLLRGECGNRRQPCKCGSPVPNDLTDSISRSKRTDPESLTMVEAVAKSGAD